MSDQTHFTAYSDEDVVEASIQVYGVILATSTARGLHPHHERIFAMQVASQIAGTALGVGPALVEKAEAWRASVLAFAAAHDAETLDVAIRLYERDGVPEDAIEPLRLALTAKQRTADDLRARLHEITGRPRNG